MSCSRNGDGAAAPRWRSGFIPDAAIALLVLAIVGLAWVWVTGRLDPATWQVPLVWRGDAWYVLALVKAYSAGDIAPLVTKHVTALGAPGIAQWNDFPIDEEPLYFVCGLLARWIGSFAAANAVTMGGHLLAALSCYVSSRALGGGRALSGAAAVLFATAPYLFLRSLPHLPLLYCWHVPLCLVVLVWGLSRRAPGRGHFLVAVLVGLVAGAQNAYYTFMFLQLAGLALLIAMYRRARPQAALLAGGIAATLASVVAVNLDTLYWWWRHGRNAGAVVRPFAGLEILALKPIDLFLPVRHRLPGFRRFYGTDTFRRSWSRAKEGRSISASWVGRPSWAS